MKWTRSELLHGAQSVSFDEDVVLDDSVFAGNSGIIGVTDVHADGSGNLDADGNEFYCDLHVEGIMICPDSITGEEIEVPFETESQEVYSFIDTDEDGVRVVTDEVIDLLPAVIDDILLEVPLQVTVAAETDYPEGDGWKVYSEAEYQESRKDRLDPRLAKLKQFNEGEQ